MLSIKPILVNHSYVNTSELKNFIQYVYIPKYYDINFIFIWLSVALFVLLFVTFALFDFQLKPKVKYYVVKLLRNV